jgi:hypothetical protein
MTNVLRSIALTIPLLGLVGIPSWAGEVTVETNGSMTWKAGVDGVELEWNPHGSMKRIYSRYGTAVEFADRRGINKAQIIAEEKAKAGIVRFMDQNVSSARLVTEVQNDVNKAVQQRETGGAAHVKKVEDRTVIETLTEVTSSFASGNLKGVIVLEKGYDEKTEEAWVVGRRQRKNNQGCSSSA